METTDYQERTRGIVSAECNIRVFRRITSEGDESLIVRVAGYRMDFRGHDCAEQARELANMLLAITDGPFGLPEIKD